MSFKMPVTSPPEGTYPAPWVPDRKDMGDTMKKSLADATATEKSAIGTFDELVAAKTKEINALTKAIEAKTLKIGELGVSIVQMKNDLSDTEAALIADKKFLSE